MKLYNPREAWRQLQPPDMSYRVLERRAREAYERGDPEVQRSGTYYLASLDWYRLNGKPKPLGRPRKDA